MSTGHRPARDLTFPLIVCFLIIYFVVIIPGLRVIRAKYFDTDKYRPLTEEVDLVPNSAI